MGLFNQWPLSECVYTAASTEAFKAPLGAHLPQAAADSILICGSAGRERVVILWEASGFTVLEELEALTDADFAGDYRDSGLIPGDAYSQSFELILTRNFRDPECREVIRWIDQLGDQSTANARGFREQAGYKHIHVLDVESTNPSTVAVFSVGGIDRDAAQRNRVFVSSWAVSHFPKILAAAPALAEDEGVDVYPIVFVLEGVGSNPSELFELLTRRVQGGQPVYVRGELDETAAKAHAAMVNGLLTQTGKPVTVVHLPATS